MLYNSQWKVKKNGLRLAESGDLVLVVERVGLKFRVLVTQTIDEMQPEEVVYSGSADTADDAMTPAERVAELAFVRIAA